MFAGFLSDPDYQDPRLRNEFHWFDPRLGGAETLASYGVKAAAGRDVDAVYAEARAAVPEAHLHFLNHLPLYHLSGRRLFVHAGVKPGVDLRDQAEDDFLWIRDTFLDDTRDHGALIIHGHTTIDAATHYGNRVNIDSGAGYGGPITAIVVEGEEVWVLTEAGRAPLRPGV